MKPSLRKCTVVCLIALVCGLLLTSSLMANATPLDKKYDGKMVVLLNRFSRGALRGNPDEISRNGGAVDQWDPRGGGHWTVWILHPVGDGYYVIENFASGRVLDAQEETIKDNGTKVLLFSRHGQGNPQWLPNQQWRFEGGSRFFRIVNRKSGRVIDIDLYKIARNGTPAKLFDWNGGRHQEFEIIVLPE